MKASEITLDTRFDEEGHSEPWRNEMAGELNELMSLVDFQLDPHKQPAKAVLSIVARVAEFEEIQTI